jgi:integrase
MKLSKALGLYAQNSGSSRKYNFTDQINECRCLARQVLDRFEGVRAYDSPAKLIEAMDPGAFRAGALVQLQSGARLDEVALIRYEQLVGVRQDQITGQGRGCISIKGKGGKANTILVSENVYDYLVSYIQNYGMYKVDKDLYRRLLRKASVQTNQLYSGSHGLRWNFARRRMKECQLHDLSFDASLLQVSQEMGHQRASITKHYLG